MAIREFGESLLADVRKRKDEQARSARKRADRAALLDFGTGVAVSIGNKLLNKQLTKLRKENTELNNLISKKNIIISQERLKESDVEFLELNLLYGNKCSKDNIKNILKKKYKVGTPEYRDCVANKGKY